MKTPQDKSDTKIVDLVENPLIDQNVIILINKPILKVLRTERLDINQLFILLSLYEDFIGLLDYYDKDSQDKKIILLEYQDLEIHGFLKEGTNTLYELTEKGKLFVEDIKPLINSIEVVKENNKSVGKLSEEFLLCFPKIKLPSGKYARVSIVEIEKKFAAWFKLYKPMFKSQGIIITNEIILKATKQYIARYEKDNYRFMVTSSYFIQKNEKSALADEILAIEQGLVREKSNIVAM